MIKSFTAINYVGDWMTFNFADPYSTGFAVTSIDGLGPVKASINTNTSATSDGSVYNSSKAESRNIVINLKFLDSTNVSIEQLRQLTYRIFPLKKPVRLLFELDNRIAATYGYVESNSPSIFSDQEGTQISIICPDSYFYKSGAGGSQVTYFYGVDKEFDFPFSNNSLNEDLLEMGSLVTEHTKSIYYQGDTETGVTITIHAIGTVTNLRIYNITTRESMAINDSTLQVLTGSGIIEGDTIYINTVKGSKYIRLLRDGYFYNILNAIDKEADWFQLVKGNNQFAFTVTDGADFVNITIENSVLFEGL